MSWFDLIGKKIVAMRGVKHKPDPTRRWRKPGPVEIEYILFDDMETIMSLGKQDPYDYHDCDCSARTFHIEKDAALWLRMFNKEQIKGFGYEEAKVEP